MPHALIKKKNLIEHNAKDDPRIVEHGILNCGVLHRKTSSSGWKREDWIGRSSIAHLHTDLRPRGNSPTVHTNPNSFRMSCLFTALISIHLHSSHWLERGGQLPFYRSSTDLPKVTHSIWQPAGIQEPQPRALPEDPCDFKGGGGTWMEAELLLLMS